MHYVLLDNQGYFTGKFSNAKFQNSVEVKELPNENNLMKLKCYKHDGSNWIFDEDKYNKNIVSSLDELKSMKIKDSKIYLEKWLKNNPLFSTVHNKKGEYYTVTLEKQAQLSQTLALTQLAVQNNLPFTILWNSTSGISEEWTFEELSKLAFEINEYVKLRVSEQQKYELNILNSKTIREIEKCKYDYDNMTSN